MKCSVVPYSFNFRASISDKEIDDLQNAKQFYSDCYIMTSLESLARNKNGRKVLKKQIEYDDANPDMMNCYLYAPDGKKKKYTVPANTAALGYEQLYKNQKNNIVRCVDISVGEYEKKYKAKPWFCRVIDNFKHYPFEHNLPSHFLKVFTGKEPTVNIAETDINIDLSGYRDEVMKLFERMQTEKDYSLLVGTGTKTFDGRNWHVYILESVDLNNNIVTVKEKRSNKPQTMSLDKALHTFKYIVGYFDSDLDPSKMESQQ